jgi:hypothetical protein
VKYGALHQSAGDGAYERYLEAIQDPRDAERGDDERMETSPREPVETRRDRRLDHRSGSDIACGTGTRHFICFALEGRLLS